MRDVCQVLAEAAAGLAVLVRGRRNPYSGEVCGCHVVEDGDRAGRLVQAVAVLAAGSVLMFVGGAGHEAHAASCQGAEGQVLAEVIVGFRGTGHAAGLLRDSPADRALLGEVDGSAGSLVRCADRDQVAVGGDGLAEVRVFFRSEGDEPSGWGGGSAVQDVDSAGSGLPRDRAARGANDDVDAVVVVDFGHGHRPAEVNGPVPGRFGDGDDLVRGQDVYPAYAACIADGDVVMPVAIEVARARFGTVGFRGLGDGDRRLGGGRRGLGGRGRAGCGHGRRRRAGRQGADQHCGGGFSPQSDHPSFRRSAL